MKILFVGASDFRGEPWGPPSVHRGIPGTEEAFIHISRELAARGHVVVVHAHVGPFAGRHGSVEWRERSLLPRRPDADVIVSADLDTSLELEGDALVYHWLHCHTARDDDAFLSRVHKIIALSHYSRHEYPTIPDEKFFISGNGIDVSAFQREVPRNPRKVVYGSDYDRGLAILLAAWPQVRAACPDAELSVFYGWEIYDRKGEMLNRIDPENGRRWAEMRTFIQKGFELPGVRHLGRVDHARVAEEFLSAGVWAYPCTFPETSCITAMKAQAAGAVPVVYGTAALRETVRWGLRVPGYSNTRPAAESRDIMVAWTGALINLLRDAEAQEKTRPNMIADALMCFSWSRVAADWDAEFTGEIERRGSGRVL